MTEVKSWQVEVGFLMSAAQLLTCSVSKVRAIVLKPVPA